MGSYVWCHGTQFDQLLWAFELYDCDKNGILAREEVEEIFIVRKPRTLVYLNTDLPT